MPLLLTLLIVHEFALSRLNLKDASLAQNITLRMTFIFEYVGLFYPEKVNEVISQIKSFLETTISVEIGWILFTVVALVAVVVVVVLKTKKNSK